MSSQPSQFTKPERELLRVHQKHLGVFKRVAERLKVDPSYVSRVAKGERTSRAVGLALIKELSAIKTRPELVLIRATGTAV